MGPLEPQNRFELMTLRLQGECSTTELLRHVGQTAGMDGWVESLPALADQVGFEPTTYELTARYSAIELLINYSIMHLIVT